MTNPDPQKFLHDNLLEDLPDAADAEMFETLVSAEHLRIERIVSRGQITPPGEWYDQPEHEWVTVLRGHARVMTADGAERALRAGDAMLIPAHVRHRVSWTDPDQETVWLAVHFSGPIKYQTSHG